MKNTFHTFVLLVLQVVNVLKAQSGYRLSPVRRGVGAVGVLDGCWGTSQTLMRSLRRDDGKMNAMDTCLRRYDNKEEDR